MRVDCIVQELNTMSLNRTWTQNGSRVKYIYHEGPSLIVNNKKMLKDYDACLTNRISYLDIFSVNQDVSWYMYVTAFHTFKQ